MTINWVFDPAPPSGARSGGNAAEYGFKGSIDTLVRETVQNSMDAGKSDMQRIDMRYRLIELTGENMQSFLDAMRWDSLQDNLEAVTRYGEPIQRAIKEMYKRNSIMLLSIEDRGTEGLTGTEQRQNDTDTNSFSALVRDELYSDKPIDAGGSFGLGKIVLWVYSAFKTVLFSSVPTECPEGKDGVRFIGRTSLPYHTTEQDGACSGSGWLGVRRTDDKGWEGSRWAESVWGQEGSGHASSCYSPRDIGDYGLSTVIVGFEEPGQETRDIEDIVKSIQQSAMESFWPALTREYVSITVTHERDGEIIEEVGVNPAEHEQFSSLSGLLKDFDESRLESGTKLDKVGDKAWVNVEIEVPERITGEPGTPNAPHPAFTGNVKVLVELLNEDNDIHSVRDHIYRFRRPGMIVRHSGGIGLSISARPYTASVLCGLACGTGEENERIEYFLRAAEPPEHDKWQHDTRAIKASYKTHGVKVKLMRFDNSILNAIRELVSLPEKKGGALPKELLKHLRFGDSTGGGNPRFLTATANAHIEEDCWKFTIKIRRTRINPDDEIPWTAFIKLKYAVDGASADDVKAISEVRCEEASSIKVHEGDAWLEFPPDVERAVVLGTTSPDALPAVGTHAVIQINVDGLEGGFSDVE